MEKPKGVRIVQVCSAYHEQDVIISGLGSDEKMYWWDIKTATWKLDKIKEKQDVAE